MTEEDAQAKARARAARWRERNREAIRAKDRGVTRDRSEYVRRRREAILGRPVVAAPPIWRAESVAAFLADLTDSRHGTVNGYGNLGCRCDRCREANNASMRAYKKKRREAGAGK